MTTPAKREFKWPVTIFTGAMLGVYAGGSFGRSIGGPMGEYIGIWVGCVLGALLGLYTTWRDRKDGDES